MVCLLRVEPSNIIVCIVHIVRTFDMHSPHSVCLWYQPDPWDPSTTTLCDVFVVIVSGSVDDALNHELTKRS